MQLVQKEDLSVANKRPPTETRIARDVEQVFAERLPSSWTLRTNSMPKAEVDLIFEVGPRDDLTTTIIVEIRRSIEPRAVPDVAIQIKSLAETTLPGATPVVAAGYLSPRSRQILEDFGVGYIDTTGNIRVEAGNLFIQTQGTDKNPWPADGALQTLRGRGTARALRAIIDTAPPFGVREIAAKTGSSRATVSRVLEMLEAEGLITREPRSPIQTVDWPEAIRRWARDYDQTTSNTATQFLAPRGIPFIEKKLQGSKLTYAATGAFAAQHFNPIAPARTATIYVDNVTTIADRLELRETDTGANVILLEPFDPVVFDRTIMRDGLRCVAPSQLAVDLLTGPGREPSQGEEILEWMKENQDAWRT
jgi:hypothetical protein